MGTNDGEKRPLTPEERQEREMRRKRMEKKRKKRRERFILLILVVVLALAAVGVLIFAMVKLMGSGSKPVEPITAKGNQFVIMLDAGHGGEDIGLSNDVLEEKTITLEIVSKLQIMLESYGYDVVLTREDDTRISKEERTKSVNESSADLLVSIHLNYADDTNASGIEVFYDEEGTQSNLLAQRILESVAAESGAEKNKAAEATYTILAETEIPAALIQVGYASNPMESQDLAEDFYQNSIAKGIAKGIIRSLATE